MTLVEACMPQHSMNAMSASTSGSTRIVPKRFSGFAGGVLRSGGDGQLHLFRIVEVELCGS
jgi:hypothetical protein